MIGWWITNFGILGVGFVWIIYEIRRINSRIDKHEEKCEARHKEFIGYMKDHEGRISHVEGRLDERQQPAT